MIRAELFKVGIELADKEAPGKYAVDCPKAYCRAARQGKADFHPLQLEIVNETHAKWKCRNCLWTDKIGEAPPAEPVPPPSSSGEKEEVKRPAQVDFPPHAMEYLSALGISPEMIIKHRLSWDDERFVIKVPYQRKGENINALLISPDEGTSRLASMKCVPFYGADQVKSDIKQIVIAQRELDKILLEEAGVQNVIALPAGGNTPRRDGEGDLEYFVESASIFEGVTRVVIAMDNTPEGDKFRYEIARRVGAGRCMNANFIDRSVTATFINHGIDLLCGDINEAMPYPITGLYQVSDFEKSLLQHFEGGMASGVSTGWKNVDKLWTVMPGELTVVTGVPNNGKSEWLDALSINLCMDQDWRFGLFSPENGKEQHVTKLVEKRVEMSASPKSKDRMSLDTFFSGVSWVNNHYYFIVADDEKDLPTLDWILDKASAAVLRYGIKGLIIDPWNEIEHTRTGSCTETEYISQALSKLKRFARNHAIALFVIAHPNKMQTDKEGYPLVPSLYDISGSAHWANKTDNGIVIHRSTSADDTTEVHVKKVRFKHVGKNGQTKLKYSVKTGKYEPLDLTPSYTYGNEPSDGIKVQEPV